MATTGPHLLPTLFVYVNKDLDRVLQRTRGTFDWNDWNVISLEVPGIALTLTLAGGNLEILNADDLKMKFRTAAYGTKTIGTYRYQVSVGDGSKTIPIVAGEGVFVLLAAVS